MPQGDRGGLVGKHVGASGRRREDGPLEELMEVRPADPAPGDGDFHRPGTQLRFRHIFDPEVLTGVETCCFHGVFFLRITGPWMRR